MSETLLSSRNLAFELYEVLDAEALTQRERFAEHNRETFDAAIGTARNIAEKYFAPHNRKGDEKEFAHHGRSRFFDSGGCLFENCPNIFRHISFR